MADKVTLQLVCKTDIGTISWSDHAPVSLLLKLDPARYPSSPWCLNTSLLQDPDYLPQIQVAIIKYFCFNAPSVSNPPILWNAHKACIRGTFIKLASIAKKKFTKTVDDPTVEIRCFETSNKQAPEPTKSDTLHALCHRLSLLFFIHYNHHLKKLRLHHYSLGNKPGPHLAKQIKDAHVRPKISYLLDHNNQKVTNPKHITDSFASYYSELYNLKDDPSIPQPSSTSIQVFLDTLTLPSFTEDHRTSLSSPFMSQEIHSAIKALPSHKSPVPDRFSSDYYKCFADLLSPHLKDSFNLAAQQSYFPGESLDTLIVTIPKPGKPPCHVPALS